MKHAPIVPDRHIVLPPPKPHLQVVILRDQLEEVGLQNLALAFGDAVDPSSVDLVAGPEEGLPARDRVGADDRVGGGEVDSGVLGSAAVGFEELDALFASDLVEGWLD